MPTKWMRLTLCFMVPPPICRERREMPSRQCCPRCPAPWRFDFTASAPCTLRRRPASHPASPARAPSRPSPAARGASGRAAVPPGAAVTVRVCGSRIAAPAIGEEARIARLVVVHRDAGRAPACWRRRPPPVPPPSARRRGRSPDRPRRRRRAMSSMKGPGSAPARRPWRRPRAAPADVFSPGLMHHLGAARASRQQRQRLGHRLVEDLARQGCRRPPACAADPAAPCSAPPAAAARRSRPHRIAHPLRPSPARRESRSGRGRRPAPDTLLASPATEFCSCSTSGMPRNAAIMPPGKVM